MFLVINEYKFNFTYLLKKHPWTNQKRCLILHCDETKYVNTGCICNMKTKLMNKFQKWKQSDEHNILITEWSEILCRVVSNI